MMISKDFKQITLAIFVLAAGTPFAANAETTFFEAGNARFVAHDFGVKLTRTPEHSSDRWYEYYHNRYIFSRDTTDGLTITGFVTALLRAALVPLENRLSKDHSSSAEIKKALLALIRCTEELCYVFTHPQDEHSIDLAWAGVDAVQLFKHIAASIKAVKTPPSENPAEEPVVKPSGITPIHASAVIEGLCAVMTVVNRSHGDYDETLRKINFSARSTMSLLRLLRNYFEVADDKDTKTQQNMYRLLIGLQALYSGLKLGLGHFDALPTTYVPAPEPIPTEPHKTSYYGGTAGWTFSSEHWDHDPYQSYLNAAYSGGKPYGAWYGHSQEDFFGKESCKFASGTPEYDFWYNEIRPKYSYAPPPAPAPAPAPKPGPQYTRQNWICPSCGHINVPCFGFGGFCNGCFRSKPYTGYTPQPQPAPKPTPPPPPPVATWKAGMMIPTEVVEKEPSKARTCALENLGLPRTATDAEARTTYKKLARTHHPDKGGDAEKFKVINQANEILTS